MVNYLTQSLEKVLNETASAGIMPAGDFNQLDLGNLCRRYNLQRLV